MSKLFGIRGFTIIELIVVIVVMGILSTFVVVQINRGQLVARDKERENDVKIIASALEAIHKTGQVDGSVIPSGDAAITNAVPMGYPSFQLPTANNSQSKAILGAIDPEALKSPLKKAMSFVAGTEGGITGPNTAASKTIAATSTDDVYVYESLSVNDSRCSTANATNPSQQVIAPQFAPPSPAFDSCVRFNIYYYSESTNSIKTLQSKDRVLPNGL